MKKTQLKEFANKTKEELREILKKEREDIGKAILESRVKKIKNLRAIFVKRKDIAKIKTLIREKELLNG